MTVRRTFFPVIALAALLVAGCGDRGAAPVLVEIDEPSYVQAMQLKKQGRYPEALAAFLKVIDRRGSRAAPDSHLEAGAIYLQHIRDPLEACHHFRTYLELKPNSKESPLVRGKVEDAKREIARSLPLHPFEDRSVQMQAESDIAKLRRENDELRAELATLRGGAAAPGNRVPRMITVPDEVIRSQPAPPPGEVVPSPLAPNPLRTLAPPDTRATSATPAPNAKNAPSPRAPTPSGRTHTVKPKETLYAISKQYGVTVADLMAANGIRNSSTVAVGAVLKIPAPSAAR